MPLLLPVWVSTSLFLVSSGTQFKGKQFSDLHSWAFRISPRRPLKFSSSGNGYGYIFLTYLADLVATVIYFFISDLYGCR